MGCAIKMPDGTDCPRTVTHHWGPVQFCCDHFDYFVWGSIIHRIEEGEKPNHLEVVEEYVRRTGRSSVIHGATCNSEKKRGN